MASLLPAANDYQLGPDSQIKEGVPHGKVEQRKFSASKIFPGTERDYWVYVPAQYDGKEPAALMVFQDGGGYMGEKGQWRVPVVMDNLIAAGQMPVTIGVFVNPGIVPAPHGEALARFNRSYEYDGLGNNYVRFLTEEFLPEALKGLNVSPDPNLHGIGVQFGRDCSVYGGVGKSGRIPARLFHDWNLRGLARGRGVSDLDPQV